MKKTILRLSIIVLVVAVLGYLGYKIAYKLRVKNEMAQKIAILPEFTFHTLNEETFSKKNLQPDKAVVVFHFNPECENCQYETKEITEKINLLENAQILMVSAKAREKIDSFVVYFKLNEIPQITVLHDRDDKFFDIFGLGMYPATLIYNHKWELVKYYKGEVRVEAIQKGIEGS